MRTSRAQFINSFTPVLGAASGDGQAVQQLTQLAGGVDANGQVINPFEGAPISGDTLIAASTAQLFSPSATDPTQALFNLIASETAFSANASAFSRIAETQDSVLDILA